MEQPANLEIAPPEEKKQVWGPWATAGFGALVLVVSFFVQSIVALGFLLAQAASGTDVLSGAMGYNDLANAFSEILGGNEGLVFSLAAIISGIVCLGLIVLIIKVRRGLSVPEYLALRPMSLKITLISIGVLVAFCFASGLVNVVSGIAEDSEFVMQVYETSTSPLLLGMAVVVVAPLFEESLVRGMLFEGFRRSRLGVVGAVIITAAVWALLHVQYGWYQIGIIFFLGIVLGVVRYKTGTLWSTIFMHALFNLVAVVAVAVLSSS